jgi:hypothetical protein
MWIRLVQQLIMSRQNSPINTNALNECVQAHGGRDGLSSLQMAAYKHLQLPRERW